MQVLAAYTEGAQILEDPSGLTGGGQDRGVQLRMPSDRAPAVAAAIATARIFVLKAPGHPGGPAAADPIPPDQGQGPSPDTSQPLDSLSGGQPGATPPTTGTEPGGAEPDGTEPGGAATGAAAPTWTRRGAIEPAAWLGPITTRCAGRVGPTTTRPAGRVGPITPVVET